LKKLIVFIPAIVLLTLACTKPAPKPTMFYRASSMNITGNRVTIMPIDVRVGINGKIGNKKYRKIWKGAINSGLSLLKAVPTFLINRNYIPVSQLYWSGKNVYPTGLTKQNIDSRDMARIIYSASSFAGIFNNKSLNHQISPKVFSKLKNTSDYTLYVANWYKYKQNSESSLKIFLKIGAIILGVVVVSLVVLAVLSKGKGAGGILKAAGKLFAYGIKGIVRITGRLFLRSVKTIGKLAIHTTRIATRVAVRSYIHNGPIVIDIPPAQITPVYGETYKYRNVDSCNRYLGVERGISPLAPPIKKYGYYFAFVLIENKTGKIMWDAKIQVPQNYKKNNIKQLLQKVFNSLPLAPARIYEETPRPAPEPASKTPLPEAPPV
jgi:hypothetical protein